jgi:hypothetical protein
MKVKYLWLDNSLWLNKWEIYKVFSIEIWKNWDKKFYIKWNSNYIYPFSVDDFEIIDSSIWENFSFWFNNFWDVVIWSKEVFEKDNFWEKYYNDECWLNVNTN